MVGWWFLQIYLRIHLIGGMSSLVLAFLSTTIPITIISVGCGWGHEDEERQTQKIGKKLLFD